MDMPEGAREALAAVNAASPFNRFAGFELAALEPGHVSLELRPGPKLRNQQGSLHAGVQAGLMETAAAFVAAVAAQSPVVTVQMSLSFVGTAAAGTFAAEAGVVRAGRSQIFAEARLLALDGAAPALVAVATFVLKPVQ